MKSLFLLLSLLVFFCLPSAAQYQVAYGTTAYEDAKGIQMVTTDSGFVMAGKNSGTLIGGGDATVLKTNKFGSLQWRFVYGGPAYEEFNSIRQVPGAGAIRYVTTGYTRSFGLSEQIYLVGLSAAGVPLFSKTYGGAGNERAYCIQNIKSPVFGPGYAIVGETTSYPGIDLGQNIYVILTNTLGNLQNAIVIGSGKGNERGYWIEQTRDGGYIVVGSTTNTCAATTATPVNEDIFVVRLRSDLSILWSRTFGGGAVTLNERGNCIKENTDGTFIITGFTQSFGAGGLDSYLLKISAAGGYMWMRTYGGTRTDIAQTIIPSYSAAGTLNYVISGSSNSFNSLGISDALLFKTDATGNLLWTRNYGGKSREEGFEVTAKPGLGGYALAGYETSFSTGSADIYLLNTDINGKTGTYCETAPRQIVKINQPCITSSVVGTFVTNQYSITSKYTPIGYLLKKCDLTAPAGALDRKDDSMLSLKATLISSELSLIYDDNFTGAKAEIINFQGKSVKKISSFGKQGITSINIDDLQNGVYLIKVQKKNGTSATLRFVKGD